MGTTYGPTTPLVKRLSQSALVFVLKAFSRFSYRYKMHMEELDEFYLEWEEDSELALDNPLCRQIL